MLAVRACVSARRRVSSGTGPSNTFGDTLHVAFAYISPCKQSEYSPMLQQVQRALLAACSAFLVLLATTVSAQDLTDIRISEISESEQWVELVNTADGPVDISAGLLCANIRYEENQNLTVFEHDDSGDQDLTLEAGEFIALEWNQIDADDGDISLYDEGTSDFSDAENIIDYVRWGDSGTDRQDEAVAAGIWTDGASVEAAQEGGTIAFLGDNVRENDDVSDWDEGLATPASANQVLPVELTSFEAVVNNQNVLLEWRTASETNNAGFEVQHRAVEHFTSVGFVEGAGTTSEPQHYRFRMVDLDAGLHAFRLKQVDVGGASELTAPVTVEIRLSEPYNLSEAHPNPAVGPARLTLAVRSTQRVEANVYDVLGRHVQSVYSGTLPSGQTQELLVRGERLPAGHYFVRIAGEQFTETRSLVVAE